MATVRAIRECYCGTPIAFRTPDGEPFEYHGPKASYLELLDGEWVSTAARPQLDHDRDGRAGGATDPLAGADDATRAAIEGRVRPVSDDHVHEPRHNETAAPATATAPAAKAKPNRSKDPEREAVKKALKAADIKFFGGATTEDLKKLLPG